MLTIDNPDTETGRNWQAWNTIKQDLLDDGRTIPRDAPRVIYPIRANQASNWQMALDLKSALEQGKIKFLKSDLEARDIHADSIEYQEMDYVGKAHVMKAFIETSEFEREITNLVATPTQSTGRMIIKETGTNRKDRYSSVSYLYHIALQFERDILKPKKNGNNTLNMAKSMMSAMGNRNFSGHGMKRGRR